MTAAPEWQCWPRYILGSWRVLWVLSAFLGHVSAACWSWLRAAIQRLRCDWKFSSGLSAPLFLPWPCSLRCFSGLCLGLYLPRTFHHLCPLSDPHKVKAQRVVKVVFKECCN